MDSRVKSPRKKATLQAKRTGAEIIPQYTGLGWLGVGTLKPVPFRWDLLP